MMKNQNISRRRFIATSAAAGGALLATTALAAPGPAVAPPENDADVLYGHGLVWNRALAGVAGDLKLGFDLRVNLETGTGFGTASDPIHPEWDMHFEITDVRQERRQPHNETRYDMLGVVTRANNPSNVGLEVRILAETVGDTTAVAIRIGTLAFAGAGLVVIAIIAVLIGLLLPAVQKVR